MRRVIVREEPANPWSVVQPRPVKTVMVMNGASCSQVIKVFGELPQGPLKWPLIGIDDKDT